MSSTFKLEMRTRIFFNILCGFFLCFHAYAQSTLLKPSKPIESIVFHLYTDSLKKNQDNYINVDALLSDKSFWPLDTSFLEFHSSAGIWHGNSIFLDSSFREDSVKIFCILKMDTKQTIDTTLFIKKINKIYKLPTKEDLLND